MNPTGGVGECSKATHTTHPTNPHTHEALWAYEAFDVYGGGEVAGLSGEGVLEVELFGEEGEGGVEGVGVGVECWVYGVSDDGDAGLPHVYAELVGFSGVGGEGVAG